MGLWISCGHVADRRISCLVEFSGGIVYCLNLLIRIVLGGGFFLIRRGHMVFLLNLHSCFMCPGVGLEGLISTHILVVSSPAISLVVLLSFSAVLVLLGC